MLGDVLSIPPDISSGLNVRGFSNLYEEVRLLFLSFLSFSCIFMLLLFPLAISAWRTNGSSCIRPVLPQISLNRCSLTYYVPFSACFCRAFGAPLSLVLQVVRFLRPLLLLSELRVHCSVCNPALCVFSQP